MVNASTQPASAACFVPRTTSYASAPRPPAGKGRDEIDPERVVGTRRDRRAERASRIERRAGDRPAYERGERDRATDRNRSRFADCSRICSDGHDHEEQRRGQHDLPHERLGTGSGGRCRTDIGHVPEREAQQHRRCYCTQDLGCPVGRNASSGKVTSERERKRHCWIQVRARDVSDGIDHRHDHEPESERDAHVSETAVLGVDHDGARTEEDESECSDRLGHERTHESGVQAFRPQRARTARGGVRFAPERPA